MSRFTRFSLFALLIVLIVPAGFAQVSNTTGALIGHVTDQAGAVLPGVTVTVTGTTLQGSRTAVTDPQGEYVLPLLPPGKYHAEYSLSGIKSQVRDKAELPTTVVDQYIVPICGHFIIAEGSLNPAILRPDRVIIRLPVVHLPGW